VLHLLLMMTQLLSVLSVDRNSQQSLISNYLVA
jgi:hypothetical protein